MTATYEWRGGKGAFNDAKKWDPKRVPFLTVNADFAAGGTVYSDGGGQFECALLSVEAKVTFTSVNGSDSPDIEASNGLSIIGGKLTLDAGSVVNAGLSGISQGQPPASATVDSGGALTVNRSTFIANAGGLVVGGNGAGKLTVSNAGAVTATTSGTGYAALTFGAGAGSAGKLTVSSKASVTVTVGGVNFGYAGDATINVSGGGTISTNETAGDYAAVGLAATSTSTATMMIKGAGSALTIGDGTLNDGFAGHASITVEDGAALTIIIADVGIVMAGAAGGTGALTVNDATLIDAGQLQIGDLGTGAYVQDDKATASIGSGVNQSVAPSVSLGLAAGSSGTAKISGAGTQLTSIGQIDIGLSGKGSFSVTGGAAVISGDATGMTYAGLALGLYGTGTGKLTVSGKGSKLTNTGQFVVGSEGHATVKITGGGAITTSINASLGVDGVDLGAAAKSVGTLEIAGGVFTDMLNFVAGASGSGVIDVGAGSTLDIAGGLILGELSGASGKATISAGGMISADGVTAGAGSGATGAMTITGAGSSLIYGSTLTIGATGNGTLAVDAGAFAEAGTGIAGAIGIATGAGKGGVTIAGTLDGASLTMGGDGGSASLKITGGLVALTGTADCDTGATITLSGGQLNATTLNFIGGSLKGFGTVDAGITGAKVTASGGTLSINGGVSGTVGMLTIDAKSELYLNGALGSVIGVHFASANAASLDLADPSAAQGMISGFKKGDMIELLGVTKTSYAYAKKTGELSIGITGGSHITLDFSGMYQKSSFDVANIAGGVMITHT